MTDPEDTPIPLDSEPRHTDGDPPDGANPFGPDAPNVREDDPPAGPFLPEVDPSETAPIPLDDADFAPDEG